MLPMTRPLLILALTESFSELWTAIQKNSGGSVEVSRDEGRLRSFKFEVPLLVSAAGVEERIPTLLRELNPGGAWPVAVVGVETSYRQAISILQSGATDYFAIPADTSRCQEWIAQQVEATQRLKGVERFSLDERARFDFSRILGRSPSLRTALGRTARVISCGASTVLITGETGTGKDLLAHSIHYNSPRSSAAFVEINCATLPEQLLEAELFGYEPGAFTDAKTTKPGLFEIANGGTLFLDEIGEMAPALQAKLLKVLEQRKVRRLGSVKETTLDIRLIAATNVDLPTAVRRGEFRQDLYYRLNVVPVLLPSLRQRGDDVTILAEHFLELFARQYNLPKPPLTIDIRRALKAHSWPGNIRELRNSIERAVLLGGGSLFLEDLFCAEAEMVEPAAIPFPASMQTIERSAATAMVARCGGNKSEAAKVLGISRKHLYNLISKDGDNVRS